MLGDQKNYRLSNTSWQKTRNSGDRPKIWRIQLIQELEDLLGTKIDIAKPETLHSCIRDQVLKEAIPLFPSHFCNRFEIDC